jgi:hypothetical protein
MVAAHAEGEYEMTTSERAKEVKFHIEFMLFMMGCGRVEEAQEHVKKALARLEDLILINTDED